MNYTLSNEALNLVKCLKACRALYEQVEAAIVENNGGNEAVAQSVMSREGGFIDKWHAMCDTLKDELSDTMFQEICME